MRSLVAILLLLLLPGMGGGLQAQDLTGQWTGTATDSKSSTKHKIVLSITEGDSSFGGVLHWYSPETQIIRHIIVSGRFYGKDSILTIREDSAMTSVITDAGRMAFADSPAGRGFPGFYILFYRRTAGRRDMLVGQWTPTDGKTGNSEDLTVRLEKKAPPFIPLLPPLHRKKDSSQAKQFQVFRGRQSVVSANIPVRDTDTLRVELYDNGEIDGDSVSLYLNDELLLQHLKLTAQAKVLMVPIDKNIPVNRLVLFAENLGKYPPNTALMEVTVRGKTYTLFLSSDFKKNASVELSLQE